LPSGDHFPSAAGITIVIYNLHRNPKYWDNPEQFLPERWEKLELKHPLQVCF
jgi:cytochrome P450